jgi:hypothetical protein
MNPGGVTTRGPVRRGWSIAGREAEGQTLRGGRGAEGQRGGPQGEAFTNASSTRPRSGEWARRGSQPRDSPILPIDL